MSGEPIPLSSNSGLQFVCHFDCPLQLSISAIAYLCHGERLLYVRALRPLPSKRSRVPACSRRLLGAQSGIHFRRGKNAHRRSRPRALVPTIVAKLVFRSERGNHLARELAECSFTNRTTLPRKRCSPRSLSVAMATDWSRRANFQHQPDGGRSSSDGIRSNTGSFSFENELLRPPPGNTVANGNSIWRHIAHQPQTADFTRQWFAPEIDDQSPRLRALDCLVDIARDIDTDCAREHADLQPTDVAVLHGRDWLQLNQRPALSSLTSAPRSAVSRGRPVPPLDINRSRFPQRRRAGRSGVQSRSLRLAKRISLPGWPPALKAAPPG